MLPRYKHIFLIGLALFGVIAITVWVFWLGPTLIVSQIQNHDRSAAEWSCRLGVSPNRDAWLTGGVFHCAVASGDSNIVVMMIERGADINRLDGYGATPLHVATRQGDVAMMSLLIRYGADPSRRDREGATALDLAQHYDLEAPRRYLQGLLLKKKTTN
jgi:hypothetical protein